MSLTVEKCLQAWSNSLRQLNVKADIVFFGDSLTYYGDFASVFPDNTVCNLGLRGDTIEGMISRVEQIKILGPDKIYLMAGINDVATSELSRFKDLFEKLIASIRRIAPNSNLFIQSILPVNDIDFTISSHNSHIVVCNSIIKELASENNLQYLDLFPLYDNHGLLDASMTTDGLHLKKEAYHLWYSVLKGMN